MNMKQANKALTCAAAIITALAALTAPDKAQAYSVQAYLMSCTTTTSVTGRMVYVGVYSAGMQQYTFTFASYCPQTVSLQ